jgi:serine/threonine protein kinase
LPAVTSSRLRVTESFDDATEIVDPTFLRARGRIGNTLRGKWRLDVLLGMGGMAAVYAATHRNGSRAAVKLLHAELSINTQVKSRFLREGYVANAVTHDGAVKVIDDDVAEDGSLFLVTELLDGETLEERRLRFGGRLDEDEVLSIAHQLLDVLAAAHTAEIVHRDIKPENVFLTRAGVVKVLDFGIARLRELSTVSTATRAGSTMGTPAFMPPEQARGLWDDVDARTDLWAVGATMFTLLTGRLVHEGRTTNEVLLGAMSKLAPPLRSILADVPVAVARVVDKALAYEKSARWADAAKMQDAVRDAYHDRHGTPITTAPRLTVPAAVVPNRTVPAAGTPFAASAARLPTTGQPVASSQNAASPGARSAANTPITAILSAVAGVGLLMVLAVVGVAFFVSRDAAPRVASASPAAITSAVTALRAPSSSPTASTTSSTTPPTIAATDLPTAASTPAPPERGPSAPFKPPPPPTVPAVPPSAAPRPSCNPPFVIDANGAKKWKAECL